MPKEDAAPIGPLGQKVQKFGVLSERAPFAMPIGRIFEKYPDWAIEDTELEVVRKQEDALMAIRADKLAEAQRVHSTQGVATAVASIPVLASQAHFDPRHASAIFNAAVAVGELGSRVVVQRAIDTMTGGTGTTMMGETPLEMSYMGEDGTPHINLPNPIFPLISLKLVSTADTEPIVEELEEAIRQEMVLVAGQLAQGLMERHSDLQNLQFAVVVSLQKITIPGMEARMRWLADGEAALGDDLPKDFPDQPKYKGKKKPARDEAVKKSAADVQKGIVSGWQRLKERDPESLKNFTESVGKMVAATLLAQVNKWIEEVDKKYIQKLPPVSGAT